AAGRNDVVTSGQGRLRDIDTHASASAGNEPNLLHGHVTLVSLVCRNDGVSVTVSRRERLPETTQCLPKLTNRVRKCKYGIQQALKYGSSRDDQESAYGKTFTTQRHSAPGDGRFGPRHCELCPVRWRSHNQHPGAFAPPPQGAYRAFALHLQSR